MTDTKTCTICEESKTLDEFYKQRAGRFGRMARCKDCHRRNTRRHNRTKPNRNKDAKERWRQQGLAAALKAREGVTGITCTVCDEFKPMDAFADHDGGKFAKRQQCRQCRNERMRPTRTKYFEQYREQSPEKVAAHRIVAAAIASGELTVEPCEVCGATDTMIDAHHDDYSKPLEVRWLCREHHMEHHRSIRDASQEDSN